MDTTQLCTYVHTSIVSISKRFTSSPQILVYQLPLSCSYGNYDKGADGYLSARIADRLVHSLRVLYGLSRLRECRYLSLSTSHKEGDALSIVLGIYSTCDRNHVLNCFPLYPSAYVLHIVQTSHGCGN